MPNHMPTGALPCGARIRRFRSVAGLAAAALSFTAGTAIAEDQPISSAAPRPLGAQMAQADGATALEPVVVSANRSETPVSEVSRSVTVIPREEIQRQAAVDPNLSSILAKTVPGMSPSTNAVSNFGQTLRGRDFLVLIDGVPQSTPLRAASRDLNTIDPSAIERIEVIRGGTAAYGFGATGGLVNIITRRPEPGTVNGNSEIGARVSTEHVDDSLEWHTAHSVSGRTGALDYLFSGSFIDRNSIFDADGDRIPPDPLGVQGGFADTEQFDVLGKLGTEFDGGNQRVELTVNHFQVLQDTDWTFGTGNPALGIKTPAIRGRFNVEDPGTINTVANLGYENKDVLGSALKLQSYYQDLTARFAKFPGFAQTEILSEKFGSRATVETPFEAAGVPLKLIWGLDYLHDQTVQRGIDGPTVVPEITQNAFAGFGEAEIRVGEWGLLRGGLRHELINLDVADVVNRRGIFVQGGEIDLNETLFNASAVVFLTDHIDLFGSFSQGFSVADIGRAIRDGTATRASQLASEAQKVDNYEVGLRGDFGRLAGSVALFYSESDNGTTFDPDLNIVKQPERIWGVETTLDYRPADAWKVGGSLTWLKGEVDLDDNGSFEEDLPATRIPPIKLTAYVEYTPFSWWANRIQALYSGNHDPDSTQFGGAAVRDYVLFDYYASFAVGPGKLVVSVENLFNEDYFPVISQASAVDYGFTKGPGRIVGVSYALRW